MRRSLAVLTVAGLLTTGVTPALVSPALAHPGHDHSAPVINSEVTGTLGENGWYKSNVTITWDVKDQQTPISSSTGCSTVSITTDQGATTYTCSATSGGGTSTESVIVKRDATAPVVTLDGGPSGATFEGEVPPAPTCTASDSTPGSGLADADSAVTGSQPCFISGYTTAIGDHVVTASAKDLAGNAAVQQSRSYSVLDDVSAPTISPAVTGPLGENGWYTGDVTVSFGVIESETPSSLTKGAGCAGASITADQAATDYTCTASSLGGTASPSTISVQRDATAPSDVAFAGAGPVAGTTYLLGSVPAAPTCTATDSGGSGFAGCEVGGYSTAVGTHTLTATAYDVAGNSTTSASTVSYTVVEDTTPPVITPTFSGTVGANGWYRSGGTLSWSIVDDESAVSATTGCESVTLTQDQATVSYTCSATSVGGTAQGTESIQIDATAPVISNSANTGSTTGWNTSAVTSTFMLTETGSGADADCAAAFPASVTSTTDGAEVTNHAPGCTDLAGNAASAASAGPFAIDTVDPTITAAVSPASNDGANGWYRTAPTVTFTCSDATSGIASCVADGASTDSRLVTEGLAAQSVGGTATDRAGRTSTVSVHNLKVDTSNPSDVAFSSTLTGSYPWGSVPAAPTCTAQDDVSGVPAGGCVVTGYSAAVGTHTLTATATDRAGRQATATSTYTVAPWVMSDFAQPVDMGLTPNSAKAGSTIPFKFSLSSGGTQLTALTAVASLKYTAVSCSSTPADEVEMLATGSTSLRYDTTARQFVYNWKTPSAGCYRVTVTAADGSAKSALFKLR